MQSIAMCGSAEQKQRWLPAMATLDKIGAFALTEPHHGSDSVALETTARRDGDHWVLDGAKRWIGNGTIADLVIVWARDTDSGDVHTASSSRPRRGLQRRGDHRQGLAALRVAQAEHRLAGRPGRRRTGW